MTIAPHISEVDPNNPRFRAALATAGRILGGTPDLGVFSRHRHYSMAPEEVLVEEVVAPGKMVLYPKPEAELVASGNLPTCWAFGPDGTSVALRYASRQSHKDGGIDVTSPELLARLAEIGHAFAAASLHNLLEVTVAGRIFPAQEEGMVACEETDEVARHQEVTFVPTPENVKKGDWTTVASWRFTPQGMPIVAGMCAKNGALWEHPPPSKPPPPPPPPKG